VILHIRVRDKKTRKIFHISIFQQIVNIIIFYRYNISWYLSSLHIQKLVLFLMKRSNKIFALNVGKLFTASLECFATVKLFHLFTHIYLFYIHIYPYTYRYIFNNINCTICYAHFQNINVMHIYDI